MAIIDNKASREEVERIKERLTNLISKTAEKTVAQGNFDTTILATIQYCSDASLGQYKIKYQNGYYTAYALDKTKTYSNGAAVYISVPQNDLSQRLFIRGLATNENSQRTYLTNLEGDQQFVKCGQNWISAIIDSEKLNLSTYWGERTVNYYNEGSNNNNIRLIDVGSITTNINHSDGYIRFAAKFKTNIPNEHKNKGDYGIRLVLVFEDLGVSSAENHYEVEQTFELNTFNMDGSPFEYSNYVEKYEYWQLIDTYRFKRVKTISGFVKGFDYEAEVPLDIFVDDVSIYAANRLYDAVANDDYVVSITAPKGMVFGFDKMPEGIHLDSLPLEGHFHFRGVEITDTENIDFYWAKKNPAVDSVGHCKYNEIFNKGWQSLNRAYVTNTDIENPTATQLKDGAIIEPNEFPTEYQGKIVWQPIQNIELPKTLCKGRTNIIKCCVKYENQVYESAEMTIINYDGFYLLLNSSAGTKFYNGTGYTNITAGVFKTNITGSGDGAAFASAPIPFSVDDHKISYHWEITNNNIVSAIPPTSPDALYVSEPDWTNTSSGVQGADNVNVDDNTVTNYLNALSDKIKINVDLLTYCVQRYNYYNNYVNNHPGEETVEFNRAVSRRNAIQSGWQTYLDDLYPDNFVNELNLPIIGPSNVTGKFNLTQEQLITFFNEERDPFDFAEIDTVTPLTNQTTPFPDYFKNTLYQFSAKEIVDRATIRVTALYTENGFTEPLETQELVLVNEIGSNLTYDLQIENGTQSFMYSAGGLSPAERTESSVNPITIKPLTFKLYNQAGELVFDSSNSEDAELIHKLEPKWKFYNVNTLLTTGYSSDSPSYSSIPDEPGRACLANAATFYYGIAKNYNVNYKERSNIELSVIYDGATYTASTHFTFVKQGDLGTNGTNMYLDIDDPVYEQYRSDLLSRDQFNTFIRDNGSVQVQELYMPDERHLKNTYLYATEIWTSAGGVRTMASGFDEGDYCNLRFAQSVGPNHGVDVNPDDPNYFQVQGAKEIRLFGYWFENGTQNSIGIDSEWSASDGHAKDIQDQNKIGRTPIYDRASFQFNGSNKGSNVSIQLTPIAEFTSSQEDLYFKPMEVTHTENNKTYAWTANNVLQCHASHEIAEQIDEKGNPIVRYCYGYYPMPFFYYGYYEKQNGMFVNKTPQGLDPARHIVITGGYDQILYGADGLNPQYNSQEPFTVHLFDENGVDITKEAFSSNNLMIEWKCSNGFRKQPITNDTVGEPLEYNSTNFPASYSLLNKYCKHDNKYWKCIVDHTPSQTISVEGHTYQPGQFVTPYWSEIGKWELSQSQFFVPPNSYEACATDSLFNSWISVKVIYTKNDKKIEGAVLIPINVLCNVYGSDEINGWDGKKTKVEDGYIISSKIAAGVKDSENRFTGITIGKKMITNGTADENEIGLFGYGHYYDGNKENGVVGHGQTVFIDAETGLAAFGPRGSTQIILNPKVPKEGSRDESWSRLGGWYFSSNYLYKPLWADDQYITGDGENDNVIGTKSYYNTNPPDADGNIIPGSVGLYVPGSKTAASELTANTVFFWASCAGVSDLNFDDNGSLQALKDEVNSIDNIMHSSTFLPYYPMTAAVVDIKPNLLHELVIANITEIINTYAEDTTLIQLCNDYTLQFRNFMDYALNACQQQYDDTIYQFSQIQDTMNNASFPTQVIDGVALQVISADHIIIENETDLRKWYCDSYAPAVTAQTELMLTLNTALNQYDHAQAVLIHDTVAAAEADPESPEAQLYYDLIAAVGAIMDYFNGTATIIQKTKSTLDTTLPCYAIIDSDRTTIENIAEIQENYIRLPATATDSQKTAWNTFDDHLNAYMTLHSKYLLWKSKFASNAAAVSYKDTDKTNASFYVTYGGKMHCTNAEVTGRITASSGHIGGDEQVNNIEICTVHTDPIDGVAYNYLLWNPYFKVRSTELGSNEARPAVYIDGRIMARDGQIGNIGANVDGEDPHTMFMEYNWYPRHLPDENRLWSEQGESGSLDFTTPRFDKAQGKIVKYSLWHPYFSVIDDPGDAVNPHADGTGVDFEYKAGDAVFMGRMYATGGRIGDWICDMTNNWFRDPYQTIRLHPANEGRPQDGYINCGKVTLVGDGSVLGGDPTEASGIITNPVWSITPAGVGNFTDIKINGHSLAELLNLQ